METLRLAKQQSTWRRKTKLGSAGRQQGQNHSILWSKTTHNLQLALFYLIHVRVVVVANEHLNATGVWICVWMWWSVMRRFSESGNLKDSVWTQFHFIVHWLTLKTWVVLNGYKEILKRLQPVLHAGLNMKDTWQSSGIWCPRVRTGWLSQLCAHQASIN